MSDFMKLVGIVIWPGLIFFVIQRFDKEIRELLTTKNIRFSGYGIKLEIARQKEWSKERAALIMSKEEKEIGKEEVQKLVQKSLDEAFVWGLRVAGYKPFNEVKDVEISKDDNGKGVRKERITWKEN